MILGWTELLHQVFKRLACLTMAYIYIPLLLSSCNKIKIQDFCPQKCIASSLQRVNPCYHVRRQTGFERLTNLIPCQADYFGETLHAVDHNEKLVMFGFTRICAIDGISGKIVGFVVIP